MEIRALAYGLVSHVTAGAFAVVAAAVVEGPVASALAAFVAAAWWGLLLSAPVGRALAELHRRLEAVVAGEPGQALVPLPLGLEPFRAPLASVAGTAQGPSSGGTAEGPLAERAAQQERNRLARELHDSLKQELFAIHVAAATAEARWEEDPAASRRSLQEIRAGSRRTMVEVDALLRQLRPDPTAGIGLVEALREQCEALRYRSGSEVELELGDLPEEATLTPQRQETLFRIAQEALTNVGRHARARRVRVVLRRLQEPGADLLMLEIADDGRGFEPDAAGRGMGLRNIRERARLAGGRVRVDTGVGRGTRIIVSLPIARHPAAPVFLSGTDLTEAMLFLGIATGSVLIVALGLATRPGWIPPTSLKDALFLYAVLLFTAPVAPILLWLTHRRLTSGEARGESRHRLLGLRWRYRLGLSWLSGLAALWSPWYLAGSFGRAVWATIAAAGLLVMAVQLRLARQEARRLEVEVPPAELAGEIESERRDRLPLVIAAMAAVAVAAILGYDPAYIGVGACGAAYMLDAAVRLRRWRARLRGGAV